MEQSTLKSNKDFGFFMQVAIAMIILTVIFVIYFFPMSVITSVLIFAAAVSLTLLLGFNRFFSRRLLYCIFCLYLSLGMLLFFFFHSHPFIIAHIFILILPMVYTVLFPPKEAILFTSVFLILFLGLFLFNHIVRNPLDNSEEIIYTLISLISIYIIFAYVNFRKELTYNLVYKQLKIQYDELITAQQHIKQLEKVLPMCSNCKKIRDTAGTYMDADEYILIHTETKVSHGLCPDCIKKLYPEMAEKILKKKI